MNRALLIACFAISTIALALSLVPRDPPPPPPSVSGGVTADDLDILERRIDMLENDNHELWVKVQQLQRGTAGTGVAAALPFDAGIPLAVQAEVAKLRDEVHGMIAGEALNSDSGKQWLRERMREIEQEDRRSRMEQQLQRAAAREQEQKAQWKKFVADAKLNYTQEQSLMKALDAESARRQALMDEVKAGTKDFREVMQQTRDLRRETDKTVKGSLDEAQQKQYEELRREQNRPRGWGDGESGGQRGERGAGGRQRNSQGP